MAKLTDLEKRVLILSLQQFQSNEKDESGKLKQMVENLLPKLDISKKEYKETVK